MVALRVFVFIALGCALGLVITATGVILILPMSLLVKAKMALGDT